MQRFFFHTGGPLPFHDLVGTEFESEDAACASAVRSMGELIEDLDGRIPHGAELVTTVVDGDGDTLITLKFTARKRQPTSASPAEVGSPSPNLARYFFRLQDGSFIPDKEGMLFASIEEAREHAVEVKARILNSQNAEVYGETHWQITATDESGETLFTLNFDAEASVF